MFKISKGMTEKGPKVYPFFNKILAVAEKLCCPNRSDLHLSLQCCENGIQGAMEV